MFRRIASIIPFAILAAAPLGAQRPDSGAFVTRLGKDTIAIERWVRYPDRVEIETISRSPRTVLRKHTLRLSPQGTVLGVLTETPVQAGVAVAGTRMLTFQGDSAIIEAVQGENRRTQRVAARAGAFPLGGGLYTPYQLAILSGWPLRADSVSLVLLGSSGVFESPLVWVGRDTLRFVGDFEIPMRAHIDPQGRILHLLAPGETVVERVAWVDVDALVRDFAARDAANRGLGPLSPADSVDVRIGGAHVRIDYSRPAVRGRRIFGGVVPWGEVWRTGANDATQIQIDRDLVFGNTTVPAGTYTLWSIHTENGAQLIINKQTRQWGTEYNPEQDLVRLNMQLRPLTSPAERFTIVVEPEGQGGILRLRWADREAFVPFTVAPAR